MPRKTFHMPSDWLVRPVRVAVVGAGGTGSQMLDALARMEQTLRALDHPGFEVCVFDPDTVSAANVGRQRFTAADIGLSKARVLTHRINLFFGNRWDAVADVFPVAKHALGRWDLVITCVDSAAARAELGQCGAHMAGGYPTIDQCLWLDTGNDARHGQVVLGHLGTPRQDGDGALRLPNVYDLYPELADAVDDDTPSCSVEEAVREQDWPVNQMSAMVASDLLWTLFRYGQTDWHGAMFTLSPPTTQALAIDPTVWAMYGYDADMAA